MFKTLKDFSMSDKRVLVRCDFNVPISDKGEVLDDFRIKQALPTIKYLIEQKAKIILMSHLGDPDGRAAEELKLDKVAERLAELLNMPLAKADDCIGPEVEGQSNSLEASKILVLENLRFYKEETEADLEFAKKLSYLGDIYINDAFSVCHRNHASIALLPHFLVSGAGLLLGKEIAALNMVMQSPEKPMVAIIGGKKVETKTKFIDSISKNADCVIISGLIKKEIQEKNTQLQYPEKLLGPQDNLGALDIDQKTVDAFCQKILQAKTILWNGPFGKFEDQNYQAGTRAIAEAILQSRAYSVVGGGETVEFLAKQGIIDRFSHVSTGGGAMLAYLAGEKLPGLEALDK